MDTEENRREKKISDYFWKGGMMNVADLPKKILHGEWSSFSITYNDHHSSYITAGEAYASRDHGFQDWVSDDERDKALANDTVWVLQWYPKTPVGFCLLSASSLEALLAHVDAMDS